MSEPAPTPRSEEPTDVAALRSRRVQVAVLVAVILIGSGLAYARYSRNLGDKPAPAVPTTTTKASTPLTSPPAEPLPTSADAQTPVVNVVTTPTPGQAPPATAGPTSTPSAVPTTTMTTTAAATTTTTRARTTIPVIERCL